MEYQDAYLLLIEHPSTINARVVCVKKFSFKQDKSSMYYTLANGLVEAFYKTLGNLLKKVVTRNKREWNEIIGEVLWSYHITFRTATQATVFSLVYGVEAVLPLEKSIPTLI